MKKIIYALCLGLSLNACMKTKPEIDYLEFESEYKCQNPKEILGKSYIGKLEDGTPVLFEFDKDNSTFSGKIENRYFGKYNIDCDLMQIENLGITEIYVGKDKNAIEMNFIHYLQNIYSYQIRNNELVLLYDNNGNPGAMVFKEIKKEPIQQK